MKIGIIGGGQLGMMMAEEALKLGHVIVSLDPNEKCPLSYFSNLHLTADYDDEKAFEKLQNMCDVVTYEFENVDYHLVNRFENKFPQKSKALYITRNRLREKSFVKELGIPTPVFYRYNNDIKTIPCVVKTTEGGYDGKGQYYLREEKDRTILTGMSNTLEYIVEEFIDYEYEISIVASRDKYNEVVTYPATKNIHRNGILFRSLSYIIIPKEVQDKAMEYTTKIIEALDYVGTMAVEFFVCKDKVIFNEYAPRPHNSGHGTIEGYHVSQFLNHIYAITGNKVEQPKHLFHTEMINVLGQDMDFVTRAKSIKEAQIHMYKKDEAKTNRKMGHITIASNDVDYLEDISNRILKE